jgi:hypothetical protein
MKPNFVDPNMTNNMSDIIEQDKKINSLKESIFPYVKNLVENNTKDLDLEYDNDDIERLSKDFSFAVACFWMDLDSNVQKDLIEQKPTTNKVIDEFDLIASRFYVSKDKAVKLFNHLYIASLNNEKGSKNERKFKN